ncbi:MAG: hypothetical protein H6Q66_1928 [Firmicutes bacterium]|nr:hypothetical protein [Bacillota bacterium]
MPIQLVTDDHEAKLQDILQNVETNFRIISSWRYYGFDTVG